jgi:anti-anti-sigma factor
MANDHLRTDRAPVMTADPLTAHHNAPADNANASRDRLDMVLDRRLAFGQAQGMLSEIAGCTPSRAGEVLLQVGAELGFDSADGVAEFFLATAATNPVGPHALAFTRRASAFATFIAGGQGLAVRGELDIATAPLLTAAFADHQAAAGPGQQMLLDLRGLTFLDVTGVRALSEIHTRLSGLGYRLRVDPPSDEFTRRTLQFAVQSGWLPPPFTNGARWLAREPNKSGGNRDPDLWQAEALRDGDEPVAGSLDLVDDRFQRVAIEGGMVDRVRPDVH